MRVSNKESVIWLGHVLYSFSFFYKNLCCRYEFQMQYGSIGWSVGATLGYAQAAIDKRVISFIGDGSFQVHTFKC